MGERENSRFSVTDYISRVEEDEIVGQNDAVSINGHKNSKALVLNNIVVQLVEWNLDQNDNFVLLACVSPTLASNEVVSHKAELDIISRILEDARN